MSKGEMEGKNEIKKEKFIDCKVNNDIRYFMTMDGS